MRGRRRAAILGGMLMCAEAVGAAEAKPPYDAILEASDAAPKDRAVQERALA